jgi:tRNA threonylcarbamoyl adenosine modification protein (Sua5/YciO/YrdC/YwlC family)
MAHLLYVVYGLGADALNASAVRSIFAAKKRPLSDPVIVHVPSSSLMLDRLFDLPVQSQASAVIRALAEDFWPGPLTVIYKASGVVPDCVTASTGFVGVRCPRHPVAQRLLEAAGIPIAAPSANRFGHVSPTSSGHVMDDLGDELLSVLEDDSPEGCAIGIESTVCRVSAAGDEVRILRCGAVTSAHLDAALQLRGLACAVVVDNDRSKTKTPASGEEQHAVAPGQMMRHYAPDVPTYIVPSAPLLGVPTELLYRPQTPLSLAHAAVIDFGGRLSGLEARCRPRYVDLSPSGDPEEACRVVFRALRWTETLRATDPGLAAVLLPDLRQQAERNQVTRALWERLHRAASGSFIVSEGLS